MKYFRQRDKYSCAPLGLMNALISEGVPVKYKDLPKFKDICACEKDGTFLEDLVYGAALFFNVKVFEKITSLKNINMLLLEYKVSEFYMHCLFAKRIDAHRWELVNGNIPPRETIENVNIVSESDFLKLCKKKTSTVIKLGV